MSRKKLKPDEVAEELGDAMEIVNRILRLYAERDILNYTIRKNQGRIIFSIDPTLPIKDPLAFTMRGVKDESLKNAGPVGRVEFLSAKATPKSQATNKRNSKKDTVKSMSKPKVNTRNKKSKGVR